MIFLTLLSSVNPFTNEVLDLGIISVGHRAALVYRNLYFSLVQVHTA